MEEQTIEYTIDIVDNVEFDVEKSSFFPNDDNPIVTYYWKYIVLNNVGLPTTTIKVQVGKQGTLESPPPLPEPFVDIPLYESQSKNILEEQFYGPSISRAKIPGKSYRNKKYPKGGELKSLINPDPIQFKAQVVDELTNEGISGVEITNSPFIADLKGQKVTSDPKGFFSIPTKGGLGKIQKLKFNVKKYGIKEEVITTQNGSIRSDINVITLVSNKKNLRSSTLKAQGTSEEEKKKISDEDKKEFIEVTKNTIIDEVKVRLLPFIIKKLLCIPYGVCDPIGLIEQAKLLKEQAKEANEKRKEKKAEKEAKKTAEEAEENQI